LDIAGRELVAEIDRWHRARRFAGCGYHYVVDRAGHVEPGRSLEKKPAAQKHHNTATIAICAHGLYFGIGWNDTDQGQNLKKLCAMINAEYNGRVSFHGHNEVAPSRACPVYSVAELLELDRWHRMP